MACWCGEPSDGKSDSEHTGCRFFHLSPYGERVFYAAEMRRYTRAFGPTRAASIMEEDAADRKRLRAKIQGARVT